MIMKTIEDTCNDEFKLLLTTGSFNKEFIETNNTEIKKIFNYIFLINVIKNRVETRKYFAENFNMTFSLMLESSYALYTGQCRAALLLLRSAQETNFKFVLEREREMILKIDPLKSFERLDYRFNDTKRKFLNDVIEFIPKQEYGEYYYTVERNLTYYKKLCGVAHSESSSIPVLNVNYYSNLYNDTLLSKDDYFKLFTEVLNAIFSLLFFMLRDSLRHWDSFELLELLHLVFGRKKSKRYMEIIKRK